MLRRPSLLSLIAFTAGAFTGCAPPPRPVVTALPGEAVETLEGATTDLAHVLKGRVALVSLWATWCAACDREVDALNRLADRTASRGDALVVGVAVGESKETVGAFVRRRGLRYPQLLDEEFHLADALGERDVPATLVVDRTGRIVHRGEALDAAARAAFGDALTRP